VVLGFLNAEQTLKPKEGEGERGVVILTINVPLILKMRDIFFVTDNVCKGTLQGTFRRGQNILIPKLS
jgi:hypothetical protein